MHRTDLQEERQLWAPDSCLKRVSRLHAGEENTHSSAASEPRNRTENSGRARHLPGSHGASPWGAGAWLSAERLPPVPLGLLSRCCWDSPRPGWETLERRGSVPGGLSALDRPHAPRPGCSGREQGTRESARTAAGPPWSQTSAKGSLGWFCLHTSR